VPAAVALTADPGYLHLMAGKEAERTLLRGFTSVRDAGGPSFALKRAIDGGAIAGPRTYPSGAFITQTAGHGDFRMPTLSTPPSNTEAETRAAVEAAENWGTYVMVHAYTPRAISQAIRAGVRCIEHGHLADNPSKQLMAETGTWWSLQPFLDDEDAYAIPDPAGRAKQLQVIAGTDSSYALARKHGIKVAWGSDILFDASLASRQGRQLAKTTRWYTPAEVLASKDGRIHKDLTPSKDADGVGGHDGGDGEPFGPP
jgi:imidazolonepropionase-like amidohydrolase